jgi:hypothetical protein
LNSLTEAPVIFLAFVMGETAEPECNGGECGGGKTSPRAKASENKGLKCGSEKKFTLPVNGYKSGNKLMGIRGF